MDEAPTAWKTSNTAPPAKNANVADVSQASAKIAPANRNRNFRKDSSNRGIAPCDSSDFMERLILPTPCKQRVYEAFPNVECEIFPYSAEYGKSRHPSEMFAWKFKLLL
jgi:hypothetical protein